MSFYRCVILISWQMSYILFLPIPPPHHCPHGPHQCPCAGPLGSRSFEPRSPNLTSGHPNTLLLLHLHLIRCFKNAMPKSALSPPLTSGHSHPPILSHHYTIYGLPTKQHQTTPLPPATIQPRIIKENATTITNTKALNAITATTRKVVGHNKVAYNLHFRLLQPELS